MANTDNKINIGDTWKDLDNIQINIGDTWKDVDEAYINIGDVWKQFWSSAPVTSSRGVFCGGVVQSTQGASNKIEYITINTIGDATDFGDLTVNKVFCRSTSNGTNERGITGPFNSNIIDYITINTTGNAADFGDLTWQRNRASACSNGTNERGIFGGGGNAYENYIDYVTINSTGNSTFFGVLTASKSTTSTSNGTNERGVFGGANSIYTNVIEYITINTTGNAADFGDLTVGRGENGGCSNRTNERGVFSGGRSGSTTYTNVIDYITINSTGNATDFGDMILSNKTLVSACSNGTDERGIFGPGQPATDWQNLSEIIEYITINTTGNASDFGDAEDARRDYGSTSNAD